MKSKKLYFLLIGIFFITIACGDLYFEALTSSFETDSSLDFDTVVYQDPKSFTPDNITPINYYNVRTGIEQCRKYRPDIGLIESAPSYVIGDGTSQSCTESALREVVEKINNTQKGFISFDCGKEPVTFSLIEPLVIKNDVELSMNGNGQITLSGRKNTRIIQAGYNAKLNIENMVFINGNAKNGANGGAISFDDGGTSGVLLIDGCVFINNLSEQGRGGAIYANRLNEVVISRSLFRENYAGYGGAITVWGRHLIVTDNEFYGNEVYADGGAINFSSFNHYEEQEELVVCGSRFARNKALFNGSAIKAWLFGNETTIYTHTEFIENESKAMPQLHINTGFGALYHYGSPAYIENSSFIGNIAQTSAATIYLDSKFPSEIVNCTFADNAADQNVGKGAALYLASRSSGTIRNCTFMNNRAFQGAAIYQDEQTELEIYNSIFYNNNNFQNEPAGCVFSYSGASNIEWNSFESIENGSECCVSNSQVNPLLKTPDYNGGYVMTVALDEESPAQRRCLNCPLRDARGYTRNTPCDVGAYEFLLNR